MKLYSLAASAICAASMITSNTTHAVTILDTSVTPIVISQPGSYALDSNVQVSSGNGIVITASGVSLDLRGHLVSGPGTCQVASNGLVTACSGHGMNSVGILVSIAGSSSKHASARIFNGAVRGFVGGFNAINSGAQTDLLTVTLTDLSAFENVVGIGFDDGMGELSRISASGNAIAGLACNVVCRVSDSTFSFNGMWGAQIIQGQIVDSVAYRNGTGFRLLGGSLIRSQAIESRVFPGATDGNGVEANGSVTLENVVMRDNQGSGFVGSSSDKSRISHSSALTNGGAGFHFTSITPGPIATCLTLVSSAGNSGGDGFPSLLSHGVCNVNSYQLTISDAD